eukprot:m51a1_g6138 hypothetical protein (778) ;mRNA; r:258182-268096
MRRCHGDEAKLCRAVCTHAPAGLETAASARLWALAGPQSLQAVASYEHEAHFLRHLAGTAAPTLLHDGIHAHPGQSQLRYATLVVAESLVQLDRFVMQLHRQVDGIAGSDVRGVLKQLIWALHCCHARGVAHGRIQLESVLVGRDLDGHLVVKLCDFTCSQRQQLPEAVASAAAGAGQQDKWTAAKLDDVWRLGSLAYYVATLQALPASFLAKGHDEEGHLVLGLTRDPASRMTLDDAASHPALSGPLQVCDFLRSQAIRIEELNKTKDSSPWMAELLCSSDEILKVHSSPCANQYIDRINNATRDTQSHAVLVFAEQLEMDLRAYVQQQDQWPWQQQEGGDDGRDVRSVMLQLIQAVRYCHARGVAHNMRPENVLVGNDIDGHLLGAAVLECRTACAVAEAAALSATLDTFVYSFADKVPASSWRWTVGSGAGNADWGRVWASYGGGGDAAGSLLLAPLGLTFSSVHGGRTGNRLSNLTFPRGGPGDDAPLWSSPYRIGSVHPPTVTVGAPSWTAEGRYVGGFFAYVRLSRSAELLGNASDGGGSGEGSRLAGLVHVLVAANGDVVSGDAAGLQLLFNSTGSLNALLAGDDAAQQALVVFVAETQDVAEQEVGNFGQWGDWGDLGSCAEGRFARGLMTKSEADQGTGDDTALNGVALICEDGFLPTSSLGPWGTWDESILCPAGSRVSAFQVLEEKSCGSCDDTALNAIKMRCRNSAGTDVAVVWSHTKTSWGEWSQWFECPAGTAVSGIRTRVEPRQGTGDDTALNADHLLCTSI